MTFLSFEQVFSVVNIHIALLFVFSWLISHLAYKIEKSHKFRRPLLTVFSCVTSVVVLAVLVLSYNSTHRIFERTLEQDTQDIYRYFDAEIKSQSSLQALLINSLALRPDIQGAFNTQSYDFASLADEFYLAVNASHNITHLSFYGLDKVVIYRAHGPSNKGDFINRYTLADAMRFNRAVSGLELGNHGVLTLRTVAPVFSESQVVGYIEAGMEIGHVIKKTQAQFNVEIIDVFQTQRLINTTSETIFSLTERHSDGNRLANYTLQYSTPAVLDSIDFSEIPSLASHNNTDLVIGLISDNRAFSSRPTYDYHGEFIAKQIIVRDITESLATRRNDILFILASILVASAIGFWVFNHVLQHMEQLFAEYLHKQNKQREIIETNMKSLQSAQESLVQQEKLASLGNIVAGVAHEINTPLGISVMMGSTLQQSVASFIEQLKTGQLRRSDVDKFENETSEAFNVLLPALEKAAGLIQSFKGVAVNQASENRANFDLEEVITSVLDTLKHKIKNQPIEYQFNIKEQISLDSYPGPLGQVITNLFENAVVHAFKSDQQGLIEINAVMTANQTHVEITVKDNGVGMTQEALEKAFDPFFTTRFGQGGSGLGLNIIFNIVERVLGGKVRAKSELNQGSQFIINIPLVAPGEVEHV